MPTDQTRRAATLRFASAISALVLLGVPSAWAQDEVPLPDAEGPVPDEIGPTDEGAPPPADGEPEVEPVPPQTVYLIAIATDPALEPIAARVGAAARSSLRQVPGVRWERPDQAYLGYTDFMLERLRRGRERLDQGRQAYLNLELERAIELLGGAVDDFDVAAPAMEDPEDLGEALLYLGASQTFAGQARASRRTFRRLHQQMPHIAPDPNVFNPDVVRRYEQSEPRDRGDPAASIVIESEPPGAIAYVDFVPRGLTPVTVEGLTAGVHTVRVTRPGATPFVQQIDLSAREQGEVNAFLEDVEATDGLSELMQGLVTPNTESMEAGTPIADIAMLLELDKLGIIRVSPSETDGRIQLELLMYDVSDGSRILRMHGPAPIELGALEAKVQELVSRGLDVALRPRATAEPVEQEVIPAFRDRVPVEDDEGGSILGEWWFWGGVGAAVVLGVLLTVVLTSGGDEVGQNTGGQVVLEF